MQEPHEHLILETDQFPFPLTLDGDPSSMAPYGVPPAPASQAWAETAISRLSPAEWADVLVRLARARPDLFDYAVAWSRYFVASRVNRLTTSGDAAPTSRTSSPSTASSTPSPHAPSPHVLRILKALLPKSPMDLS